MSVAGKMQLMQITTIVEINLPTPMNKNDFIPTKLYFCKKSPQYNIFL